MTKIDDIQPHTVQSWYMRDALADDVAIIIPVYNESAVVGTVIRELQKYFRYIVCVDDGSKDDSRQVINETAAYLVEHPINMGQGAALQTGVEFARQLKDVRYFVMFDADGQHRVEDVQAMLKIIRKEKFDIVLGSRFLGSTVGMKKSKEMVLRAAIKFSNWTSGLKLTDTHNGLRVFGRKVADELRITMPDMAHASEILEIIAEKHYSYTEVPVVIKYSDYSRAKGQSIINAVNIGFDTLLRKVFR